MQGEQDIVDDFPHALCEAAKNGDLSGCQVLVSRWQEHNNASTHLVAEALARPLTAAINSRRTDIVAFLMQNGAIVRGHDPIYAMTGPDTAIAMFQTFYDNGWDVNSKTELGNVMLKHVISDESLVRWFLGHGANANFGEVGCNSLDVAAAHSTPVVFDLLVAHGASVIDSDALHSAADEVETRPGRVEMMQHLIDLGFDVNAMGRREFPAGRRIGRGTPLHSAMGPQEADRIELLLQRGADLNVKNTLGQTPLEYAIAHGYTQSQAVLERVIASS